ncbi:hypothetical protein Ocin01_10216 [Orchesella cincta]|uniref:Uncharacterized protein n=1 Tax=Orchesella cincta TaxID=48709 RepID=A0A1D2MUT3_ORCCI|nr:hypothetical protein Ocin01_10216 [Orchesella cincta]
MKSYAQATTDKPRNDKQLYEQFLQFQNYLLSQNIMTDSDSTNMGCKWRDKLHRINDTRFFIYDTIGRKDIEANFTTARAFCEALNEKGLPTGKWRLARIEHLTTFRMITRKMEEVAKGASQHNNEVWIDAFFNYDTNTFQDSDGNILKFNSVLLYRHYKPMGIGAHEKHDDKVYNITKDKPNFQQCLTLSLPWPNEAEKGNYKGMTFGHQASFEERACEATQKFKPICENLQPECRYSEDLRNFNYFPIEGYAQKSYVDDGVWVFANRRFLVNLTPRNKTESEKFCESIKTKLYTPRTDDTCLIAYLKLWNIHLTHLHFWTTIKAKYTGLGTKDKAKEKDYQSRMSYENGTDFTLHRRNKVAADKLTLSDTARVDWIEQNATLMKIFDNLCVTANWAYDS